MLERGMKMFLNFPNESKKLILHPGMIKEAGECDYTADLEETDLAVEVGQDVFVYYELKRKLVKQAARRDRAEVAGVIDGEPVLHRERAGRQIEGRVGGGVQS